MKSKEQRAALHTTPKKTEITSGDTTPRNGVSIIQEGDKMYQKTKIDNQDLFVEVKTSKE